MTCYLGVLLEEVNGGGGRYFFCDIKNQENGKSALNMRCRQIKDFEEV